MLAHLCFLQETCFRMDMIMKMYYLLQCIRGDLRTPNLKGSVSWATILSPGLSMACGKTECRALFLKGNIGQLLYMLVNLYLPNTNHVSILEFTLEKLGNFAEGSVILGGDFNLALDLLIDTSCTSSHLSYTAPKCTIKNLHVLHLADVWRIFHLDRREFYSHPHNSYMRIDLFLIHQSLLSII